MGEAVFKEIGQNIVLHRRLRGINQINCAAKTGIGVGMLSKIERGIGVEKVPLATYIKIAEALNLSFFDLLRRTEVTVKSICVSKKK
ncbi:MAG: helix-turn-helix transcriptional regulator [Phascolarctobacterium sp.]|nr:helix-turn-helix transcriptional regulator [Phascolarctobacterium sp.]